MIQVLEYDLKPECLVILAEEEMVFIDLGFLIFLYYPPCVLSFILFFTLVQQYPILPCFSFKRLACLPASLFALDPR